jgi:hypothetical protein
MADGEQNYLSPASGTSTKQINIMMSPQQVTHMKRMITRSGNSVSSNSEDNFVNWDTNQDKLQMKVGSSLKANVIKRLADDRIEPPLPQMKERALPPRSLPHVKEVEDD